MRHRKSAWPGDGLEVAPHPMGGYLASWRRNDVEYVRSIPDDGVVTLQEAAALLLPPATRWRLVWWTAMGLPVFRFSGRWLVSLKELRRFARARGVLVRGGW